MKHLLIIGARGFGREVYRTFVHEKSYISGEMDVKGFLDDKADALDGLDGNWPPIIGSVETYEIQEDDVFFCALGDPHWRKHYTDIILNKNGEFINIIHMTAMVSPYAKIGTGCFIGAFTTVSPNVTIGNQVMIQSYDDFGHDSVIGDYASIESYVFLGGCAKVGEFSTMHTKSSIIPHKSIGKECVVGFGSVVMRNFKDGTHVFGNPAKKMDL
jgi:sugar O-acyltransferase (sialic acid O-acetyltransferase NeuD family)